MMQGILTHIFIRPEREVPAIDVSAVEAIAAKGLVGDHHTKGGNRQVTILSQQAWDTICRDLGATLNPKIRKANFVVTGIDLERTAGQIITIGPVSVRILGETNPCRLMDEAHQGLKHALSSNWRGGAYGEILVSGKISVGDLVILHPKKDCKEG